MPNLPIIALQPGTNGTREQRNRDYQNALRDRKRLRKQRRESRANTERVTHAPMIVPDLGDTIIAKKADGIAFLMRNGDLAVPCSRYGDSTSECAPVAWRVAYVISKAIGGPIHECDLDHAMGLVVNEDDSVASIIRLHGGGKYR